ncbi:TetR/AcrR family transcriptional regulator C-terminal domain-containing protein, partial [Methylobacterium organophilum]|uniref:TetR/AcrR family transcriptional regulator C-terminal domain-containing protein n=1 Tax=Methylobacterium organophilum TaxID=410 RepID=UPI0032B24C5D
MLDKLSRFLLACSQDPGSATLTHYIVAQALQFPNLARLAYEEGWLGGVRAVAPLLEVMAARGQIAVDDVEIAADLFLNLVPGRSSKQALYGIQGDPEAQEKRCRAAVALFLAGVRPQRQGRPRRAGVDRPPRGGPRSKLVQGWSLDHGELGR